MASTICDTFTPPYITSLTLSWLNLFRTSHRFISYLDYIISYEIQHARMKKPACNCSPTYTCHANAKLDTSQWVARPAKKKAYTMILKCTLIHVDKLTQRAPVGFFPRPWCYLSHLIDHWPHKLPSPWEGAGLALTLIRVYCQTWMCSMCYPQKCPLAHAFEFCKEPGNVGMLLPIVTPEGVA